MCLSELKDFRANKGGVYYKVIHNRKGVHYSCNEAEHSGYIFKRGVNVADVNIVRNYKDSGNISFEYESGFHCFTNLKAARKWTWGDPDLKIIKVHVSKKNITTKGVQSNYGNCIVAKKLTIKSLKGI